MSPRAPKPPPDPASFRRTAAGRHETGDERFVIEQSSGGWLLTDTGATDEFGLPLVRGPFATLEASKAAAQAARSGPAPASDLAERAARLRTVRATLPGAGPRRPAAVPAPPPLLIREFRPSDGPALRAFWASLGMHSLGDDDRGLVEMARRNPGLLVVAARGRDIVASALGGWDGRRGWLYHVASAPAERRAGLATTLVRRVEARLRELGAPKVNVVIREGNEDGAAFWEALGYRVGPVRQFGRVLSEEDA